MQLDQCLPTTPSVKVAAYSVVVGGHGSTDRGNRKPLVTVPFTWNLFVVPERVAPTDVAGEPIGPQALRLVFTLGQLFTQIRKGKPDA